MLAADDLAAVEIDFAGLRIDDVADGDRAFELLAMSGRAREGLRLVERLGNALVAGVPRVHRAEQRHGGGLCGLVDWDGGGFFLGGGDLDPGAAFGNDAAGVQLALAGFGLDDVIDAGRAVQLRHYYAL